MTMQYKAKGKASILNWCFALALNVEDDLFLQARPTLEACSQIQL